MAANNSDWTFRVSASERRRLTKLRRHIIATGKLPNLKTLVFRADKYYGDSVCVVERIKGEPVSHTCRELKNKVDALGTALLNRGFKGKHLAIIAENSFDWLVAFFAVSGGVGVAVPIDKQLRDDEISNLLDKADCEGLFFSKAYAKTAKFHLDSHPGFMLAVGFNKSVDSDRFATMEELIEEGERLIRHGDRSYINAEIDNDSPAAIFFTSGTTGANKGVVLSHKNLCTNVNGIIATIPTEYSSFSVLPMNHVYELSCNCFTALYMNAVIYINDSLKNIQKNLLEFKPEAMGVVPMIVEGLYNGIWANAREQGKEDVLRKLVAFSNAMRKKGIDLRPVLFKTISSKFCERKFPTICCGGAPSRAEYMTGMGDFGFRIYNGYGMTEASPSHTLNLHAELTPASAGKLMPGGQLRIDEPDDEGVGEIWIKGDNVFSGYYKDPEATAASFEDGWFKTGDYGRVDAAGNLYISGRKKNIIILDNGENVFPEDLEFAVMDGIPYVTEAVAIEAVRTIAGKEMKIIAAVVYVDPSQFDEPKTHDEINEMLQNDIAAVNKKLAAYKKIQSVILVDEPMEKNTTMKVIRQKVIDKYAR
ncbi:MAG: AMP-binding protein [Clostridia bacterium]|nr:AMP-binding protein [Clostridia bacterium]